MAAVSKTLNGGKNKGQDCIPKVVFFTKKYLIQNQTVQLVMGRPAYFSPPICTISHTGRGGGKEDKQNFAKPIRGKKRNIFFFFKFLILSALTVLFPADEC